MVNRLTTFLAGCCLFFCQPILAQHTISGIVSDLEEKNILIHNVAIFIPEFNRTEFSREGGTYIVRNIGIGTVHIQFSKQGYKTILKVINTTDSATVVNVEMEKITGPFNQSSEAVIFSCLPEHSPVITAQYPSSTLRRTGDLNYISSLSLFPGIENSTVGNINFPVIRGLSFNHIVQFQSGASVLSHSLNQIEQYSLMDEGSEFIEVLKGPQAVLYGQSAMGGVIVYHDEKMPPSGTVNGAVSAGFHSNTVGIYTTAGIQGANANGLFYSIRFGEATHASYVQGSGKDVRKNTEEKKYAFNSALHAASFKAMLGKSWSGGQSKLTFAFNRNNRELVQSYSDSLIATFNEINERNRKPKPPLLSQSLLLVSSENTILAKKSKVVFDVNWQHIYHHSDILSPEAESLDIYIPSHYNSFNAGLRYSSDAAKKYGITIGTQGSLRTQENSRNEPGDYTTSFGLLALFRYSLHRIDFLAGARVDKNRFESKRQSMLYHVDRQSTIGSGSVGAIWQALPELNIKVNASSGFSLPVLGSTYDNYIGKISYNLNQREEKNYEGDAEIEWHNKTLRFVVNTFYNAIQNFRYLENPDSVVNHNPEAFYYAQKDAVILGSEAALTIHPQDLRWIELSASYAMVRGAFTSSKKDLPQMPADKIITSLRFQSEKMNYLYDSYIIVRMRRYMKQERIYGYERPTEGYSLLDLQLGGSFHWAQQTFDISLSVNNILDKDYFSHLSQLKYASPIPVHEMGRDISLHLHIPFGLKN